MARHSWCRTSSRSILAVAALIGTTVLGVLAMEQGPVAPSTVTVTVQTDDGCAFRLNGRVILDDAATPDTVIVEIWKNGTKSSHWFVPVPDSVAVGLFWSARRDKYRDGAAK